LGASACEHRQVGDADHAEDETESTRVGQAIRHAARSLRRAREPRRVVLLLTDGAPSDVDVGDPQYLVQDARHAVAEARRAGLAVSAVSLDRSADRYVQTIFGAGGFFVLDRPQRLPEVLTRLYARLSR
ncbi:MAG TPA: VWA domain-containing protein, partial [Polyangiales bacterium]|nr:VWA domain-containing protein [Polyangiales bacterium]